MRSFTQLFTTVALAGLASVASAAPTPSTEQLAPRANSGQGTYFAPGLGACGWHSGSDDMIVALTSAKWDGGAHCGKWVTINHGGSSVQAKIVDECPTCGSSSLDLSPGAFKNLASLEQGEIRIDWHYNN